MQQSKIKTKVDVKYLGKQLIILNDATNEDSIESYIYKASCDGVRYVLKGYRIELVSKDKAGENKLMKNFSQINEIYQEFFLLKAACKSNPYLVKPLFMDYQVELTFTGIYLYIEILFENGGISLEEFYGTGSVSLEMTYNLMRQSANALLLLQRLGLEHAKINPTNMMYDKEINTLKIDYIGNTLSKLKNSAVAISNGSEYTPPEILRADNKAISIAKDKVDVYCWGMIFYSLMKKKIRDDDAKYKQGSEEEYKRYIELVESSINAIEPKNSLEVAVKDFIRREIPKVLKYNPNDRPRMQNIVSRMKGFERIKDIELSHTVKEHNKKMEIFLLTHQDKEEQKADPCRICKGIRGNAQKRVVLSCKHTTCKDCMARYTLDVFMSYKNYYYICKCPVCKKDGELKSIELDCGCRLTHFENMECNKGHSLAAIDIFLITNYIHSLTNGYNSLEEIIQKEVKTDHDILKLYANMLIEQKSADETKEARKYRAQLINEILIDRKEARDMSAKECEIVAVNVVREKLETEEKEFDMPYDMIDDEGVELISEAIRNYREFIKLRVLLYLKGNREVWDFMIVLKYNKTLKELSLGFKDMRREYMRMLGEVIKDNKSITQLDLVYTELKDDDTKIICKTLKGNKILTHLRINSCSIGDEGARAIAQVLKVNKILSLLSLKNNKIKDKSARLICEGLKINKTLTELDIGNNELGVESGKAFSKVLKVNKTLTSLNMKSNNIRNEGGKALSEALKVNKTLKELVISYNWITDAREIGYALKINTTLEVLGIDDYELRNADAICKVLETNKTLKHLKMNCTTINTALGEALKVNTTLLSMSGNNFNEESVISIGEALKINRTLMSLNMYYCHVRDKGLEVIGEALKVNNVLIKLNMLNYNIRDSETRAISDAIRVNNSLLELSMHCNLTSYIERENFKRAFRENKRLILLCIRKKDVRTFESRLD